MELSHGELMVMELLWEGECLDENGEIQALELSKLLYDKYGMGKTSCYTFFGRFEALKKQREEAIEMLFQGSIINVCRAFLSEKKVSKQDIQQMRDFIDNFEVEE